MKRVCQAPGCTNEFEAKRSDAVTCSPACRQAASREARKLNKAMKGGPKRKVEPPLVDWTAPANTVGAQVAASGVVTIPAESLRGGDSLDQLSDRAFEALERFRSPGQTLVEANEELILSNLDNEWFAELYRDAQLWRNRNGSGPVVEPLGRESGSGVSDEEDVEEGPQLERWVEVPGKVTGGWPLSFSERVREYEGDDGEVIGRGGLRADD